MTWGRQGYVRSMMRIVDTTLLPVQSFFSTCSVVSVRVESRIDISLLNMDQNIEIIIIICTALLGLLQISWSHLYQLSATMLDYPEDVQLKKRKEPKQSGVREVRKQIAKPLPEYKNQYWDPATFNYDFMFVSIPRDTKKKTFDQFITNFDDNQGRAFLRPRQVQMREQPVRKQQVRKQQVRKQQVERQPRRQPVREAIPAANNRNVDLSIGSSSSSSQLTSEDASFLEEGQKILAQIEQTEQKLQAQEPSEIQSAISGLADVSSYEMPKIPSASVVRNIEKQEQNVEQNDEEDREILSLFKELSSIKMDQSEIQNEEAKEKQQARAAQQLRVQKSQQEKAIKTQELIALPKKKLQYLVKVQNCKKVCLKIIRGILGEPVLLKNMPKDEIFSLDNLKKETQQNKENIWEVGQSRIPIEPLLITVNCSACRNVRNRGVVLDRYFSSICTNPECKVNLIVEFIEIKLS